MSIRERILELPPYPSSWYAVGESAALKPGAIMELQFCGQQAILFRTESGQAVLSEAYCPHMGAHLARGGRIEGETIACPFHGFCFDTSGQCVKTGYGTKPPKQAVLKTWPVMEMNGVIMAWQDATGKAPDWTVPELDWEGWTPVRFADWRITSHPQEIAENSADVGHFRHVHGYDDVKVFMEAQADGHILQGKYGMSRAANFVGIRSKPIQVEFNFFEYGLGMAHVEAHVPKFGLNSRHFVYPMPIDGKEIVLRIGVSVNQNFKPSRIHPMLGILPKSLLMPFIASGYYREYKRDVSDDFKVWTNKVYVHPPYLAQGDGPVVLYRKWAAQFY